jgi:hypothetical protein
LETLKIALFLPGIEPVFVGSYQQPRSWARSKSVHNPREQFNSELNVFTTLKVDKSRFADRLCQPVLKSSIRSKVKLSRYRPEQAHGDPVG